MVLRAAELLLRLQTSVLPRASLLALPAGLACASIKVLDNDALDQWKIKAPGYKAFSGLLGFLIVFRVAQAHSRHWRGCRLAQAMIGNFFDATSGIVSLAAATSKADRSRTSEFRQTVIALTSILSAACFCDMAGLGEGSEKLRSLEAMGWQNFDAETRLAVQRAGGEKVRLVFFWWQSCVSLAANEGIVAAHPSLISRVFGMVSTGVDCYEQANQLTELTFPIHYTRTTVCLLLIHMVLTPLAAAPWTERPLVAFLFSFMMVFGFWVLYLISNELEHPFGDDATDIDVSELQRRLNQNLRLLVESEARRSACFSEGRRRGKGDMGAAPGACLFGQAGEVSSSDDEPSGLSSVKPFGARRRRARHK